MIEPEVAFNDITDNMDLAEDFIKYCVQWALDNCADDEMCIRDRNDGSTINNVQIVVDLGNFDEEMLKEITTGACLSVNGCLLYTSRCV